MEIYVVKQGDTVGRIAGEYSVSAEEIIYINQLADPSLLVIGQALLIPAGERNTQKRQARINGYAYPFIDDITLRQTLPFLTEVSVFSYGFTPEGELIPPALDDTFLVEQAYEFRTLPILTLTPFGADGQFNNYLIHSVVQSESASAALTANLTEMVVRKGFAGTDIDFEYILAEDRDAFTAFVRRVAEARDRQTDFCCAGPQAVRRSEGTFVRRKGLWGSFRSCRLCAFDDV